jgi:hypothetical protein
MRSSPSAAIISGVFSSSSRESTGTPASSCAHPRERYTGEALTRVRLLEQGCVRVAGEAARPYDHRKNTTRTAHGGAGALCCASSPIVCICAHLRLDDIVIPFGDGFEERGDVLGDIHDGRTPPRDAIASLGDHRTRRCRCTPAAFVKVRLQTKG